MAPARVMSITIDCKDFQQFRANIKWTPKTNQASGKRGLIWINLLVTKMVQLRQKEFTSNLRPLRVRHLDRQIVNGHATVLRHCTG